MTKVSIVVTAYNRKNYVLYALKSATSQDANKSEYEIILVKNFLDSEIDNYCNENCVTNILATGTVGEYINLGINAARGDIICFLDDDDLFTQNKVSNLINIYERTHFSFLHNNYLEIDETGKIRPPFMKKLHFNNNRNVNELLIEKIGPKDVNSFIKNEGDFNISCMSVSRKTALTIAEKVKQINACQDGFLFYSGINEGKAVHTGLTLTLYRVHHSTSNKLDTFTEYRNNLCKDVLSQLNSLQILFSFHLNNNVHRAIESAIGLRMIKLRTFKCKPDNSHINLLNICKNILIPFNLFNYVWMIVYFVSLMTGLFAGKAIFSFIRQTMMTVDKM